MRKQTHFKKVVSFALAAAMAVSVCTAALADEATNGATNEAAASEQIETKSADETENDVDALTAEEGGQPAGLAAEGETQVENVAYIGEQGYPSLAAAFAAVQNGEIVLVKQDCDMPDQIIISGNKSVTLDLGDSTVSATNGIHVMNGATLTIKGNGVYKHESNSSNAFNVWGYTTYENDGAIDESKAIRSTVTVESGTITAAGGGAGIGMWGNGATVNINGGKVESVFKNNDVDGGFAIAGNGIRNGKTCNGGTELNINGGEITSVQDCAIYLPQIGVTNITGGTIRGWSGIEMDSGTLNISGGKIESTYQGDGTRKYKPAGDGNYNFGAAIAVVSKGNQSAMGYAGHMNVNITGGEIVSASYYAIDEYNLPYVQNPDGKQSVAYVDSFKISGDAKIGGAKGAVLSDNIKNFISSGNFTHEISEDYIAEGKICKVTTDANYPYVVGEKVVDVKPAEPEKTEVAGKTEDIKSEDVDKNKVVNAAASTTITDSADASVSDVAKEVTNSATVTVRGKDVAIDSTEASEAAKDAISSAVADNKDFDPNAKKKDITIVAVPKLVVEPKAATDNETDKSMTFDISMVYDVKATVADTVDKMNNQNTVTLEKNKEMPAEQVPTVAISLDVSALKIPEGQKVFVRHVKEDGTVYYYEAETKTESGIVKTITFVNPDGFSEFTVMANKTVTVTIDGKEYALSAADIGKGFEIAKKDYCDWKGVSFKGIEGVYTTLTKELYDKAANGQKLEGTNVFEQVWFPPEEPTPAPTAAPTATPAPVEAAPATTAAPTATPDDSQYYTCVACGHHNWTATADGYKCNTCGHLETKQISGYKNVKGTYAPTASSAKTAAATASTIPQTSDEMPIVPIAIIAIAALLGLGVTAYMKKKQN